MWNPDVTVRSRGVMEKCTYCVQRINERPASPRKRPSRTGKPIIKADDGRWINGSLQTACQQACPTHAITFGDINDDKSSEVCHLKEPTA